MHTFMLGFLGGSEMILILVVAAVFFGAKKLPDLARGLGQGIREFKKASNEVTNDIERAVYAEPPPAPSRPANPQSDASEAIPPAPLESEAQPPEAPPKEPAK